MKKGDKVVYYGYPRNAKVYTIDAAKARRWSPQFVGKIRLTITGKVDGDAITVASVKPTMSFRLLRSHESDFTGGIKVCLVALFIWDSRIP